MPVHTLSKDAQAVLAAARRLGKEYLISPEVAELFAEATRKHLMIREDGALRLRSDPEAPDADADDPPHGT
ncbi:hypothetical protein HY632_04680 [Candidatus Uhrbacteria bacterium]|nr:hypothetical protein [Candidatus Uhrbacteria bacterium]